MKWISPKVSQWFQVRTHWNDGDGWVSGAPINGIIQGKFEGIDRPLSPIYTVAWFAYFQVDTRAYTKLDENPNDTNVYMQVDITTIHNVIWTSAVSAKDGFIDIGIITWAPGVEPGSKTNAGPEYLYNQSASKAQLYDWIPTNDSNVVCGVIADNGNRTGQTVPIGSWGSHGSGDDNPVPTRSFELVFTEADFNDDGTIKDEKRHLPFLMATRFHPPDRSVSLASNRTLDIDLSVSPFEYIPWAIRKNGSWVSCNRRDDGLMVHEGGGWNKVVKNNFIAQVRNGKIPINANGFRVQRNGWNVSPITPDE